MVIFEDNVKQLCYRICKELGQEPIHSKHGAEYWRDYERMVTDWLVTEAFSKVRGQYWDEQNRSVKPSMTVVDGGMS
jgi:hypothetical protein